MILGGDIGGTKTLLALAGEKGIVFERRYPSSEWGEFPALLRAFLDEAGPAGKEVASACFGVAGPVEEQLRQGHQSAVDSGWPGALPDIQPGQGRGDQ
ncbi:MAG: glucokinase [Rhodocyclaceae bacterium]|nr:glucokinase [Rhodocyclaceae bacterium]